MKEFDVKADVEYKQKNDKHTFLNCFAGSVGKEVAKVKIEHRLQERYHKFEDGETGKVAKKLLIVIDFGDSVIQPHSHFEDDFCSPLIDAIAENVNGIFENSI